MAGLGRGLGVEQAAQVGNLGEVERASLAASYPDRAFQAPFLEVLETLRDPPVSIARTEVLPLHLEESRA